MTTQTIENETRPETKTPDVQPTLVWVRICPTIQPCAEDFVTEMTIRPALHVCVYGSEKSAREAAQDHGGIVLQILAASLKGQNGFDDGVLLSEADEEFDGTAPESKAYINVIYGSDFEYQPLDDCTVEFSDECNKWLDELESATGFTFHI